MRAVLVAAAVALFVSLLGTPLAIRLFVRRGYGQLIRDDGPTSHHIKRGTPTMGGAIIIIAALIGYAVAKLITLNAPTASGLLVLFLMTGLGVVGFIDDFIKISKQRSLGLRAKAKLAGQTLVAVTFAVLALQFKDNRGLSPASTQLSFIRDTGLVLGPVVFVIFAYLMIAGMSNGVNLTDGLDGLATGTSVMVFASYILVGVWQFGQSCALAGGALASKCYDVRDPLDLAVVAAAVMGACFGFLWWNASPARIFMGDTGSLALGGGLAGIAIVTRTELLLALLGGLFVIITLSVIIQVGFFKLTGRRVFRMAPLQHHFELAGWDEITIVIRFWIVAGLCVAFGLAVFYAEWVTGA
ncbi:MAG TPA: phospho-N-acetylmuramoyl-pentapeptide-transferase [Actinomycetes bacterium]|nr:phospho-N-acetylmuramoyl-pentapeptide-transferase [Actinomycetes bacterium]